MNSRNGGIVAPNWRKRAPRHMANARTVPRGKYTGERIDKTVTDEREHFERCPACGGWIDLRNLGQVLDHARSLPHPPEEQPQ